jgi:hypothetical protein
MCGVALTVSVGLAGPAAAELTAPGEIEPDPEVLTLLNNLGENESAWLPPVKTRGEFNEFLTRHGHHKTGPRPRNYCLKWVWAADRQRALFCGGNAGVPHKLNDVWEYDLASNTWILLWEPDPDTNRVRHMTPEATKQYLDEFVKLDADSGELMTRRGAPFDPVHTWWELTYDPEMHALLWIMGNHHLHDFFLDQHPDLKDRYKMGGYHPMRLWAYYPHQNKWEFIISPPGLRKSPAAILEYIPQLQGSLYYTESHAQQGIFHSKTRQWTWQQLASSSTRLRTSPDFPLREAVAAYDSLNKVLVAHHGGGTRRGQPVPKRTWHYDVRAGQWERIIESDEGPVGADNQGPMVYDSAARACFLVAPDGLWRYKVGDKRWLKVTPTGPAHHQKRIRPCMACYNPQFNVLMVDGGHGQVWVYRAKVAK